MSDTGGTPPLGYTPNPLEHHRVTIEFDVVARSADEAAYIIRETLIEDLAAPSEELITDGVWILGEPFDDDVPGIRRWKPATATQGLPADLLAMQILRTLIDPEQTGTASRLLAPRERARIAAMLDAADLDVIIPDPDAAEEPPIYEGPASEAHNWIPAGVYDAAGADGHGYLRVVVGPARVGSRATASAAFVPADHDTAAMNEIAAVLDRMAAGASPLRAVEAINQIVMSSGRPGFDPTGRRAAHEGNERAPTLEQMLARREHSIRPVGAGAGPDEAAPPGRTI